MNDGQSYVYEVDDSNILEKVVEESKKRVVVVDFWAEWCAPCKMLGPILENIAASFNGRVVVAKVNVDENQELAAQFGIRSIPSVKIFKDGAIAGEFVGVRTEQEIVQLLTSLTGGEGDDVLSTAGELLEQGNTEEAASLYRSLLEENPGNAPARLGLARIELLNGEPDKARELLESIGEGEKEYDEACSLLALYDFNRICCEGGGYESVRSRLDTNPGDLDAAYALGCCYGSSGRYDEALSTFLDIVRKDRAFAEGKAKNAMIALFNVLGHDHELTRTYRGKLASELF